jgi:hypothetical protein
MHEWLIRMPANNNLKKIRLLLNGDTLYALYSFIPTQYIDDPDHSRFFTDFRVTKEIPGTSVFTNKADKLFTALQSADSATFAGASDAFGIITFSRDELPYLHRGLITRYPDDTLFYNNVHDRIIRELETLADNSTVDFIKENYFKLTGDKEKLKTGMLSALAGNKTQYSYNLLKELLVNNPPQEHSDESLSYKIGDSLLLCRTLFPEVLQLAGNSIFWKEVTDITRKMLDSSMIGKDMIAPYRQFFLFNADTVLHSLKAEIASSAGDDVYGYEYIDLLKVVASLNDKQSNELLRQYHLLNNMELKYEAILLLLKNGQPADIAEIEKIAADNYYRQDFYNALKEQGKEQLFPAKYRTQKYFAEATIFTYASDDYDPSEIISLGERSADFNGKKSRFYLFKVVYKYDDADDEEYFAVAGPYSFDGKDISSDHAASGIFFDETYSRKLEDKHFKELLKRGEEYIRNRQADNE